MYPAAKQPRRGTSGCLTARSGASIRRVRGRRVSLRRARGAKCQGSQGSQGRCGRRRRNGGGQPHGRGLLRLDGARAARGREGDGASIPCSRSSRGPLRLGSDGECSPSNYSIHLVAYCNVSICYGIRGTLMDIISEFRRILNVWGEVLP